MADLVSNHSSGEANVVFIWSIFIFVCSLNSLETLVRQICFARIGPQNKTTSFHTNHPEPPAYHRKLLILGEFSTAP